EPEGAEAMGVDEAAVVPSPSGPLHVADIELPLADDCEPRPAAGGDRVERGLAGPVERRLARELLHLEAQDVRVPKLDVVELTSVAPHVGGRDPRLGNESVHAHTRQSERLPCADDRVL